MTRRQAEWWLSCWLAFDFVDPDDWYEAMAVLLAERASA